MAMQGLPLDQAGLAVITNYLTIDISMPAGFFIGCLSIMSSYEKKQSSVMARRAHFLFFPKGQFLQQGKSPEFTLNVSLGWCQKQKTHHIVTDTQGLLSPFCS